VSGTWEERTGRTAQNNTPPYFIRGVMKGGLGLEGEFDRGRNVAKRSTRGRSLRGTY